MNDFGCIVVSSFVVRLCQDELMCPIVAGFSLRSRQQLFVIFGSLIIHFLEFLLLITWSWIANKNPSVSAYKLDFLSQINEIFLLILVLSSSLKKSPCSCFSFNPLIMLSSLWVMGISAVLDTFKRVWFKSALAMVRNSSFLCIDDFGWCLLYCVNDFPVEMFKLSQISFCPFN